MRGTQDDNWAFWLTSTTTVVLLLITANPTRAQGKWYANGFIQYSFGDYTFGTNTNTLYFIPGILYESDYWDVSAALSVVSQNNNLVTRAGGMLLPHGGSGMSSAGMGGMGGSGGTSMMSGGMTSVGLGDTYLSGEYWLSKQPFGEYIPSISIGGQLKIPTAGTADNFGTGKFDFSGTLNLKEQVGTFIVLANGGDIVLGKPTGVDFRNPFTYGGAVGKVFDDGNYSLALMYQGYTTVLAGYAPPNGMMLGFNWKTNSTTLLTIAVSKGLTNTSSAFGITGGLKWELN